MARLIYVERVIALDDLERAALTPAALFRLSFVSPEDLERLRARMAGRSEVDGMSVKFQPVHLPADRRLNGRAEARRGGPVS
jgi:hypothetical protein